MLRLTVDAIEMIIEQNFTHDFLLPIRYTELRRQTPKPFLATARAYLAQAVGIMVPPCLHVSRPTLSVSGAAAHRVRLRPERP